MSETIAHGGLNSGDGRDMRKYALFTTVLTVLFLSTFTAAAISVALPEVRTDFNSSWVLTGWVISGYLLAVTISVALGGRLSDAFGQKRLFLFCLGVFTLGTFFCMVAPNMEFLVACRIIQGLGGGALGSIGIGIVAQEFASNRQKAIGLLMGAHPLGAIAGPNLGAWMIDSWGWRSTFWAILPLLGIAFIAAALTLRSGNKRESNLDLPGAFMMAAFLSAIMISLSLIKQSDTPWMTVAILMVIGISIVLVFLRRERRVSNPIMDLQLLKRRAVAATNGFSFLLGASTLAAGSFVPAYAVSVYNETTLKSGVVLTPRSIAMVLVTSLVAMYVFRAGYRLPLVLGSIVLGLAHVLLAIQPHHIQILGFDIYDTTFLFILMALSGFGLGAISAVINNVIVDLAPDRAATASGLRMMFLNIGGMLSVVALSLVLDSNTKDMAHGFFIVFAGLAMINLVSLPLLFVMPARPTRVSPK